MELSTCFMVRKHIFTCQFRRADVEINLNLPVLNLCLPRAMIKGVTYSVLCLILSTN